MNQPRKIPGARLCLAMREQGLTVYCNPDALRSLAEWLQWIASHNPAEHFECHVRMDLEDDESKFENKVPSNVLMLVEKQLSNIFSGTAAINGTQVSERGFELTFMAAPEEELDEMARLQIEGGGGI